MKSKLGFAALVLILMAATASAQFEQDPADLGVADTVDLVFSVIPDATTNQLQLQADLWVFNDSNQVTAGTMGFTWDNPNLQMDSAVATPLVQSAFDLIITFYENQDIAITNANQRFQFGGVRLFAPGIQAAPARQHWASYYFTLSNWNETDSIVIDTLTYNAGTVYKLTTFGDLSWRPLWTGPEQAYDSAYTPPSNLIVEPDSMHFNVVEGQSGPPPQTLSLTADGSPLAFSITEDSPWLVVSPIQGTTPQNVNVVINTNGLTTGEYIDTLVITSPGAANSPQMTIVTVSVAPPPPIIGVSPSIFYFNAVAGGANPDPKSLLVFNSGEAVLNWTLTHSEAWLTLSPEAGVDSGNVTVSVDIAGLAYGDYVDTIFVSDPEAQNDPVAVPVYLSVGSDLPVIAVDSTFHYLIIDLPATSIPDGELTVFNSAAGGMTFWIEENSPRITVYPDTGTAPSDLLVYFKVNEPDKNVGWDFYDTVWVYSNEAINSPLPVVYQFHYVEEPAEILIFPDTLELDLYECSMGFGAPPPSENVMVFNNGGDNPMHFNLEYESEYFWTNVDTGTAQGSVTFNARFLNLPEGDYYDTVLFYAINAVNSPETLIVHYDVNPAADDPFLRLSAYTLNIPTQAGEGPLSPFLLQVYNQLPGCMPWSVTEDVPWLEVTGESGNVPGAMALFVDGSGYGLGQYNDSLMVIAADATNSPQKVNLLLKVWLLHGDNDWSGDINVSDITYLVNWLFGTGGIYPPPQPEMRVGDCDCDGDVNVADLTYLVDYLFAGGPIPCGNPY